RRRSGPPCGPLPPCRAFSPGSIVRYPSSSMFTGIVAAVGRIAALHPHRGATGRLPLGGVRIGDSICVQGCCLTVVKKAKGKLWFDVSKETLRVTAGLNAPGEVNLEKSLGLGDKLGGHLVTGHVDGIGRVVGK